MEKLKEYRRFILSMKVRIMKYVLINAFLVFVNWMTGPQYWWVLWVIAGWGLGVVISSVSEYMDYKLKGESKTGKY